MISHDLARRLHDAGLTWSPRNGDTFWVPDRELDDTVFTVSDMVVEVRDQPHGRVLAFNGTTEWALDDVDEREAVWLPRLDQLLELLGPAFVSLTARSGGYVVRVRAADAEQEHVDVGAQDAVARALLALLDQSGPA
ncbi:pilus assembly protein CpaE [Nocardioides KLBMP 9356]|uniref:Pilus assembly protein CpaE n=1 Tax=Nocardioides potassii TaxID=2911371 RepID=A0ABS9H8I1_9ACTN|nr:pilus assembly protein CpaE [Nocardioides potassii]MCF6376328.1 pilus assembly protein CpaE [Nocardioides potassii]